MYHRKHLLVLAVIDGGVHTAEVTATRDDGHAEGDERLVERVRNDVFPDRVEAPILELQW
jgi:hypothetical protein